AQTHPAPFWNLSHAFASPHLRRGGHFMQSDSFESFVTDPPSTLDRVLVDITESDHALISSMLDQLGRTFIAKANAYKGKGKLDLYKDHEMRCRMVRALRGRFLEGTRHAC
ncbi:MAG: hypothetical protein AAFY46_16535, partial [Planctomycetota bacterium]